MESPKSCRWTSERLHHGDDVCGGLGSRQNQIDRNGGDIAEERMAKDVKVVKNIKTSVLSFRDIRTNGHLLR
jgi:hypothetical protein